MPAFPIPALPSLDSFRSLIDTSPPVFYPAEAANHVRPTRERRRSDLTTRSPSRSESGSREPGRSRSRSTTGVTGIDSPLRRPRSQDHPGQSHTHTRAPSSSAGTLLPANASAIDLDKSGEWEPLSLPPVARVLLARRNSTGAPAHPDDNSALSLAFDPVSPLGAGSGCSSSPGRPGHRRSHSAAPATTPALAPPPVPPPSNRRTYAPFGRLREFSRNPLASTSAVSLPTLVELDGLDGPNYDVSSSNETIETISERGSPLVRPRNRRLSKASAISPASPLIPARSPPMSPLSVSEFALPPIDSSDSDESGEARPLGGPLPSSSSSSPTGTGTGTGTTEAWQASSVPPPQAVGRMRPHPPARSWSQDIVDLRPSNTDPLSLLASSMTTGHGHGHGRRHSVTAASSSLSDVAVLATWSFPSSPDRQPVPAPTSDQTNSLSDSVSRRSPDRTSRLLRERLRTLSQLDTTILPGPQPLAGSGIKRPDVARSNMTVRPPLRPFLAHRHTHSSPSLVLPHFVPPTHPAPPHLTSTTPPIRGTSSSPRSSPTHAAAPTRHARRPTTSRLRNPAPLSMPCSTPNPIANTNTNINTNTNTNTYLHPNPANVNPHSRPRSQCQSLPQSQSQSQPKPLPQSPSQIPSIPSLPPAGLRAAVPPQGDREEGGDRSSGLSLAIGLDLSRSRANTLSFNPGSLTDDSTSTSSILCPSPTASIVCLPPLPPPPHLGRDIEIHPDAISAAATVALATRDDKDVWWKRWESRRRSVVDQAISTRTTTIEGDIAGLRIHDMSLDADKKITEEEADGDRDLEDLGIDTQISLEEQFLDFDDI